jgi:hypothetical protein
MLLAKAKRPKPPTRIATTIERDHDDLPSTVLRVFISLRF